MHLRCDEHAGTNDVLVPELIRTNERHGRFPPRHIVENDGTRSLPRPHGAGGEMRVRASICGRIEME